MTYREWTLKIRGYAKRRERDEREQWEHTRAIAFNIHAHSMAEKKKRSPQQFWPLPWDTEGPKGAVSDKSKERLRKMKEMEALGKNMAAMQQYQQNGGRKTET